MGSAVSSRRRAAIKSAAAALVLLIAEKAAASYLFQRIVDTSTPIPGGVGAFTAFDEVAYDGQHLAFRARGATAQEGVYLWDGASLSALADANATAPEGAGRFENFLALSLDAGHVAFVARGTLKDGVYTTLGGALRRVADTSMTMPSSVVPFTQFAISGDVAISGDNIVFSGSGAHGTASNAGVYLESGGALARVADRTTAIPEFAGSFVFFSAVDAYGGEALFAGGQGSGGGGNGFYTTSGAGAGQLRAVLNVDRAVPGLSNPISIFSPNTIRIDGSTIAFSASDSLGGRGVYLEEGGLIHTIADKNTLDPFTGAPFSFLGTAYSVSGGAVAFQGSSTGPAGLYVHKNGMIDGIIQASTMLDSKTVASLSLYGESLANDQIAFRAGFTDGTSGIYVVTPSSGGPDVQIAEFSPLFDAGSSDGDVIEGEEQISVQIHAGGERRACLEFDLSQLPAGAVIESATLRVNVNAVTSFEPGEPSLKVYGYAGDGALDISDPQRTEVWLGQTAAGVELGALDIDLETTPLQDFVTTGGIVGLVMLADAAEHLVSFDALEDVGGAPPKLTIEYSLAPGDFNGDGVVDASDLARWKSNFGSASAGFSQGDADGDGDVDGSDFLVWQRGLSAAASSVAMHAPEAATWRLFLAAAGLMICRKSPRGVSSVRVSQARFHRVPSRTWPRASRAQRPIRHPNRPGQRLSQTQTSRLLAPWRDLQIHHGTRRSSLGRRRRRQSLGRQ